MLHCGVTIHTKTIAWRGRLVAKDSERLRRIGKGYTEACEICNLITTNRETRCTKETVECGIVFKSWLIPVLYWLE